MIRYIKIALAAFVSVFCLLYALQNIANLQAAYAFVAYTVGMAGHEAYPHHIGPAIQSSALIWVMLWIIIILEFTAGLLAAKGSWDLFQARRASNDCFDSAKKFVYAGCGLGVLIWFGLFSAIGGAYFQMWQTEAGNGALHGSFWYSTQLAVVWLLVAQKEA